MTFLSLKQCSFINLAVTYNFCIKKHLKQRLNKQNINSIFKKSLKLIRVLVLPKTCAKRKRKYNVNNGKEVLPRFPFIHPSRIPITLTKITTSLDNFSPFPKKRKAFNIFNGKIIQEKRGKKVMAV